MAIFLRICNARSPGNERRHSPFAGGVLPEVTLRPRLSSSGLHMSSSEIEYLRQQAEKCFRLSRSVNDPKTVAELEKLGREFERRAAELENEA